MNLPSAGIFAVSAYRTALPSVQPEPYYRIRITLSGYGFAEDDGRSLLLCPGIAMLIRPDEAPGMEILTEKTEFLDFRFAQETADLLQADIPVFSAQRTRYFPPGILKHLMRMSDEIQEEKQHHKPGYQLAALEKILVFGRLLSREGKETDSMEAGIAATLKFIVENFSRDITLRDLAGLIGVSISCYRRNFRQLLGIAPIDCLLEYRLLQAENRLRETGLSIAEIASETGFNDANYFSRIFARRKGKSPRAWRQSAKEK